MIYDSFRMPRVQSILQAGEGEPLVLEMMYVTYIPYVTMILNIPVTLGEKGHV